MILTLWRADDWGGQPGLVYTAPDGRQAGLYHDALMGEWFWETVTSADAPVLHGWGVERHRDDAMTAALAALPSVAP